MKKPPELSDLEYCLYLMSEDDPVLFEYFLSYYLQKFTLMNLVYPQIASELKGYNDHGYKHVKNIINLQEKILISNVPFLEEMIYGEGDDIQEDSAFNFYELYLLLSATLWHDVGNIVERFHHNEHIPRIEAKIQHYFVNTEIKDYVLHIAKAHTGSDGVRAQINLPVSGYCNEQIFCQFIGALLRFTDELDEGQNRLNLGFYERFGDSIEEHQKIFWEVCNCIKRILPEPRESQIIIDVNIKKEDIFKDYLKILNKGKSEETKIRVCLIDELIFRINKINQERIYYMEFVKKFLDFKEIKLNVNILDGGDTQSMTFSFNDQFGYDQFWETVDQLNPEILLPGYILQLRR